MRAQGDKPQGTMWESMCGNIQIDYNGNQGVFTEIDQCQNEVRTAAPKGRPLPPASCCVLGIALL